MAAKGPARAHLGMMLTQLWEAGGSPSPGLGKQSLRVDRSRFLDWRRGAAAPSPGQTDVFWSVVRVLQDTAGYPLCSDADWQAALNAARQEAITKQHGQLARMRERNPDQQRFVGRLQPAVVAVGEVRDRRAERAAMNALVGDLGPSAPSYLCWYGDGPVGKTALLADYVLKPPPGVNILNFFLSVENGTHTRAAFEEQMAKQLGAFLGIAQPAVPFGAREWRRLLRQAAQKSMQHGRGLLLIVDSLDDDVAWSEPPTDRRVPKAGARVAHKSSRGSIAALLPASPPSAMRIIVSLRRCVDFPGDFPAHHPLRQRTSMRPLAPITGLPTAPQTPPGLPGLLEDSTGVAVAGLLAAAGGGLRMADLAQLTEVPIQRPHAFMEGPQGRSFVFDDPVSRTYALAGPGGVQLVCEHLGEDALAQYARMLLDWSQGWCAAGWPEDTPPYPLLHQLRLLTTAADRAAYVLDLVRLRRLARAHGPETAFAQLEAFEAEADAGATEVDPAALATLACITVARSTLKGEIRDVIPGAPALLFRLGKTQRAYDLARSAATAEERAVHLAELAVEKAHLRQGGTDALAEEAVGWLTRDHHPAASAHCNLETNTRIIAAARTLVSLDALSGAQHILRAVVGQSSPGIDVLRQAGELLAVTGDVEFFAALWERAETLSEGGIRARAAAVELWGVLLWIQPSLSPPDPSLGPLIGDRISALCDGLGTQDGLGAADVLSIAASTLASLPGKRKQKVEPGNRIRQAVNLTRDALHTPDALSQEDRAHLGRELSATLARLIQALDDTQPHARGALDDIEQLLAAVPQELHIGVLGDAIAARARAIAEDAAQRRAQSDRDLLATIQETKNAARRSKGAERSNRHRPQGGHRPSAGLKPLGDGPHPEHVRLLHEADERLGAGDPLDSQRLLETALQRMPAPKVGPSSSQDWRLDLAQALGTVGDYGAGEALADTATNPADRARLLAALSVGCSLGGYLERGSQYANHAAALKPSGADPSLANATAQALAYAGHERAASAAVTGRAAVRRQAMAAVAAGLVRHRPEEAARIAAALTAELRNRIDEGSPLHVLPELAGLLLAYPDVRQPAPGLHEALQLAAAQAALPRQSWHRPSMAVLQLLQHCDLLPQEDAYMFGDATERWRSSIRPGQEPHLELALLFAMDGETAELMQHAEAARNPGARAQILRAGAMYFAGGDVALAPDSGIKDKVLRICLALAQATGAGSPPNELTAGRIVRRLLATGEWAPTISLLPRLAPGALDYLSRAARSGHMLRS